MYVVAVVCLAVFAPYAFGPEVYLYVEVFEGFSTRLLRLLAEVGC